MDSNVRYRYLGIKIPITDTFEGKFKLHTFDLGLAREIPVADGHGISSDLSYEGKSFVGYIHDDQAFQHVDQPLRKVFNLKYNLQDAMASIKLKSALDKVTYNRRAVWILEHYLRDREQVYLCLADRDAQRKILLDEDGDEYFSFDIAFKSVK